MISEVCRPLRIRMITDRDLPFPAYPITAVTCPKVGGDSNNAPPILWVSYMPPLSPISVRSTSTLSRLCFVSESVAV